jgi:ankyrin repeat protein
MKSGLTARLLCTKVRNFDSISNLTIKYTKLAILGYAIEKAKLLINNGADVNKKNNEGQTALHLGNYFNF